MARDCRNEERIAGPGRRASAPLPTWATGTIAGVGVPARFRHQAELETPEPGIPLASSTVRLKHRGRATVPTPLCKVGIEVAMENGIANGLVTVARTAVGDFSCESISWSKTLAVEDKLNYRRQESAAIGARQVVYVMFLWSSVRPHLHRVSM